MSFQHPHCTTHKTHLTPFLFISFILLFFTCGNAYSQVAINEVLASNGAGIPDEDGDTVPWIELYNTGEDAINLNEYGLSDDYDEPFRWVMPEIEIGPEEFLLIFASGKDRDDPDSELHTNFRVSKEGEEVILTAPEGDHMDEMLPTPMRTDISFGRQPNGTGDWYFFEEPTPGAANDTEGYLELLDPPEFSREGGFYSSPFELDLHHPDPDVTIYYTLDGSEPDDNSSQWNQPMEIFDRSDEPNNISTIRTTNVDGSSPLGWIEPEEPVKKSTVIRAKAAKPGYSASTVQTHTYFVHPDGEQLHELPVFSLVTDSLNLFDHEEGIYVPGARGENGEDWAGNFIFRGIEWERPGSLEFFEEDGSLAMKTDMGYRIHGGHTRRAAQKSLRLYARNDYGSSRFEHQFFPDQPYDEFNRLLLRNSGNDWGHTMFRDAMAQMAIRHMNFDTQAYRPSVLYINGEYWGIHNIRERYDKHYLERVYEVDPENIDLLTSWGEVKEGDTTHIWSMRDYAENRDLSDSSHYDYMNTLMDIDHYIDYYTAQVYIANNDWPHNNIDYWRLKTEYDPDQPPGKDGRWRWLLYDVDRSFNFVTNAETNMIEWVTAELDMRHEAEWPNLIFRNLLENENFKNAFINRIAGHLNTTFLPQRLHGIISEMQSVIEPEIDRHILRWGYPYSMEAWLDEWAGIEQMRQFADDRPDILREHIRDHFEINSDVQLTVDVSDQNRGYIQVDSISIEPSTPGVSPEPYPWEGIYFEDVPLELKAIATPGYRLQHWIVDGETVQDNELILPMNSDTSVEAVFEVDENYDFFPEPFVTSSGNYLFTDWNYNNDPGEYPDHMAFVFLDETEPGLDADIEGFTGGAYDLDSRTRINGLDEDGFAFINTSNLDGNPGYPGRRLGGAILALDTRDTDQLYLYFSAGTVRPNSRVYNLRLQYRIGEEGELTDFPDANGDPIEYQRHPVEGHIESFGPIAFPEELLDERNLQLFWRYYYTGERLYEDTGQRAKLNISHIEVSTNRDISADKPDAPSEFALNQNYPNPFNNTTEIVFELANRAHAQLRVYSITGETITTLVDEERNAGIHNVSFDASGLASGVYIYRLETEGFNETKKMMLIR